MIGKALTVADLAVFFEVQSLIVVDFDLSPWKKVSKMIENLNRMKEVQ